MLPSILAIDTSSEVCSVALNNNEEIFIIEENRRFLHASLLTPIVKRIINLSGISKPDAIAIAGGPGSYTGLRIGFGTAKGLCYAWNIPLIGVSSLYSIVWQIVSKGDEVDYIIAVMDSRKGEVYAAIYDSDLGIVMSDNALSIEELEEKIKHLNGKVLIGGNGTYKLNKNTYKNKDMLFYPIINSASAILQESVKLFNENKFESIYNYKPLYLK